jgi:glycerate kinase
MVPMIDKALAHLAVAIEQELGMDIRDLAGTGAAGGLGAGLVAFAGAELRSGPSLVLQLLNFEEFAESADLILAGEGKIDRQLEFGKALSGLALLAEKHQVPLVAFTGWLQEEEDKLSERGIQAVVPIATGPMEEEESVARAGELLQAAAERAMRLLKLGRGLGDGRWLAP